MFVLFAMSPGAKKRGSVVVNGCITQCDLFHGLEAKSDTVLPACLPACMVVCVFVLPKFRWKNACLSIVFAIVSYIFMDKHSRNTISDRLFFLGIGANVLLRIFCYNTLGACFEALVQRTGVTQTC